MRPDDRLIGRSAELDSVRAGLLAPHSRLLVLTGPPGIGKTRLAAAAAQSTTDRFTDGTFRVDLTSTRSADAAVLEIGRRLGLGGRLGGGAPLDRLTMHVHAREVLLVLDSCEVVSGLGQVLVELLRGCARMVVVATSRERLHIASEREYPVPPLAMPAADATADLAELAVVPAMDLLVTRTAAVRPGFVLSQDNAAALAGICRQLDGLPLAIEVAAARLGQFEPREVAVRLRRRDLLLLDAHGPEPGRHRTLRTAIAWSHDLLSEQDRAVFRRLAAFPAGWSLAASDVVVTDADHGPVVDVLTATTSLLDKSLVRRITLPDGTEGYTMLDSIREYAAQQLERSGEQDATEERFRRHYARLAAEAEHGLGTLDEPFWFQWHSDEIPNLRAALSSALQARDVASALPLAAAVGLFCYTHGSMGESRMVDRAVRLAGQQDVAVLPRETLPGALVVAGILGWARREHDAATQYLRRGLREAESAGDQRTAAVAHAFLGHVARTAGLLEDAVREHTAAGALFRGLGNPHGMAWSRHDLALDVLERDDVDEAERLLTLAGRQFDAEGDTWAYTWTRAGLGECALRRESWELARELLRDSLDGFLDIGDRPRACWCLERLAVVAGTSGHLETGLRLLGTSHTAGDRIASPAMRHQKLRAAALQERAVDALGPTRVAREIAAGRDLTMRAALAVVDSLGDAGPTAADSPLTERQREIAARVAEGETNRQMARDLGISEKTVEMHLRQAMDRLGVHSRAQVAAHAVRHGLR
ncbi:MAG: LuxR C-terminal-related transcriptional regulator [Intrasporangium sp.]|uniref:ATP-binding protein n=1 Tax=Intrasporangium sp. TaxID=1925024 RepID=UPI002647FDB6|nr:LuxR C-terminal-related transcriptional regulator [Intrasporangium sp.]MDN5796681.1 LuxR C-terminal-related transcriptional regulator [Intrasporangium sp.]